MRETDSAGRVVRVLDLLAASPEGLTVSEVARGLGVHKTTASRLLGTLARSELLEREGRRGAYRLGPRIVSLAGVAVNRLTVVSQARSDLERLARASQETANLAILDGAHVVYVDQVTPPDAVLMASWIGRRSPVHASSSGKVLLAFGDESTRDAAIRQPLDALTRHTITDPARFARVLAETRRRGYARSQGELEEGLVTIAAPVVVDGRAVAAASVSGPVFRIPASDQPRLAAMAIDAAAAIANRIRGRAG